MTSGELKKKIFIECQIIAKTGLHVGGTNMGLSIGGADATVVRNPISNEPYIPGSSLKGKMRSLLEKIENKLGGTVGSEVQVGPYVDMTDDTTKIPKLFGATPNDMGNERQPSSRIIVRDCELDGIISDGKFFDRNNGGVEKLLNSKNTDMPFTEVKTEVVIDRITSAANPRNMERVPAGAVFSSHIILNVYSDDNEQEYMDKIFEALRLVQDDYIGGKGTRGSGEVEIIIKTVFEKDKSTYEDNKPGNDITKSCNIPIELTDNKTIAAD